MLVDSPSDFVIFQSARATLWRTLQRAASALMPTLGWFRNHQGEDN